MRSLRAALVTMMFSNCLTCDTTRATCLIHVGRESDGSARTAAVTQRTTLQATLVCLRVLLAFLHTQLHTPSNLWYSTRSTSYPATSFNGEPGTARPPVYHVFYDVQ